TTREARDMPDAHAPAEDLNPARMAAQQFDRAVNYLPGMRHGLIDFLKRPARTIALEFPIELDDGTVQTFLGYRVLHSRVPAPRGGAAGRAGAAAPPPPAAPAAGLRPLAAGRPGRRAAPDVPCGGARGGAACPPKRPTPAVPPPTPRRYIADLGDNIGPYVD